MKSLLFSKIGSQSEYPYDFPLANKQFASAYSFSHELIHKSLIRVSRHIPKQTAVVISWNIEGNPKLIFGVFVDFSLLDHVDVLECFICNDESLCFDAESDEHGGVSSIDGGSIQ